MLSVDSVATDSVLVALATLSVADIDDDRLESREEEELLELS